MTILADFAKIMFGKQYLLNHQSYTPFPKKREVFLTAKLTIKWSQLAGMKFCLALPGSRQCYKLFINYILRLHVKRFIPARRNLSFIQPGSHFAGTKFFHVIASARLGGIKKLIKKYPQKYIPIDRRYFCYVFTTHMTPICEKKS